MLGARAYAHRPIWCHAGSLRNSAAAVSEAVAASAKVDDQAAETKVDEARVGDPAAEAKAAEAKAVEVRVDATNHARNPRR